MKIDADRWERIQALFHAALELSADARAALLDEAHLRDPALADEVRSLLEEDARSTSLLDRTLGTVARDVLDAAEPVAARIGPYRITGVLGRGGMGVVYLAERDDLGSRAAIKMLRDAWLSPARRERFAAEQRTLARLNHPNIARLYDADTLPDGTPYFVMEHVQGTPLTDFCDAHALSVSARLRLFRDVCDAVQHAHRHAILHRDLKPSNILVTQDGVVKLLDFGIAKQLEGLETPAKQTQTVLLMTPAYAAPEQLRGEPVGLHTDVYALGVILYELLAGQLPFDLSNRTPGAIEAEILGGAPERPSTVARRARDARDRARTDRTDIAPPPLPGRTAWADLDGLCLTAMHVDPARRYRTVDALARDVDRYLSGRPLEARPDSAGYRLRKFARRRWRPLVAAAAMLAAVIGLVAFYTVRLAAARDAALAQAASTQRIQRFMLNLFEGGDEAAGPADTLRVVSLVGRGVQEARLLDGEPEAQAELYATLGGIYQKLGDFDRADTLLRAAVDGRRRLFGAHAPELAQSLVDLGLLRADQAQLDSAEQLVREGLDIAWSSLPPGHATVLHAMTALGHVLQARNRYDSAIVVLDRAVAVQQAGTADSVQLSETLTELANTYYYAGDYAVSDSLNRLALAMDRRLHGERHPVVADGLINLGAIQFQLGNYTGAEKLYRQALEIIEPFYGPDHYETASNLTMIARTIVYQGRTSEAERLLRRALAIDEKVYGPVHPATASTLNELGSVALQQNDFATAEADYLRMAAIYRAVYDEPHSVLGIALANLGSVYMAEKDYRKAEPILRQSIDILKQTLPPDHMQTAITRIKLGRVLLREGRYAEAERETRAGHDIVAKQASPTVSWLKAARTDLIEIYTALGRTADAARFRAAQDSLSQ